jgi:TatD DNase family protein
MIDLHCHLDLYPNPSQVVLECKKRGLYILSVTTTPSAWTVTNSLADNAPRIKTALGLHPQIAHERISELPLFDKLLPQTRYVGEVGLDGAPEFRNYWTSQTKVFEHILNQCTCEGGRIMTIHSRRAAEAVLDMLNSFPNSGTAILHWFSGRVKDLDRAIEMGCWFSVGPSMLQSNSGRKLLSRMPPNRVLPETDGPFARIGNQTLMPWQSELVIQPLSEIWSISLDDTKQRLENNFRKLVSQ